MDNENNKLYIHMSYYNGTSKNIELNLNTMEETVIYSTESNEYAFVPYEYGNDVLYFQDYNSTNGLNMHIYDSNSLLYTVDTSNKYFIDESSIATKHAYWIENSVFSLYELDAYEGSFTKKYDINNFPTSPIEFVNENYILVSTEATNCHYKDETFNNSMYELFSISDRAIVESIYMC